MGLVVRRVGVQHLAHARNRRRILGHGSAVAARHQHMDVAADARGRGNRVQRGRFEYGVVVFRNDQGCHQITFASSLSRLTSSAVSATLMPALRVGRSLTCRVTVRGAMSMPSSAALITSLAFFLAFMMLGSVMKRGSFRRRSVVITAGSFMARGSRPAAIPRRMGAGSAAVLTPAAQ